MVINKKVDDISIIFSPVKAENIIFIEKNLDKGGRGRYTYKVTCGPVV